MRAIPIQPQPTDVVVTAGPRAVLAYERRRPRADRPAHTRWGTASLAVAALTAAYTVTCAAGLFLATGWGAFAWLYWGIVGNWLGGGVGFLLGIVGCSRRSRLRERAAKAACFNVLVVAVPIAIGLVPFWLN